MSTYEFPRVGRVPPARKVNAANVWTKAPASTSAASKNQTLSSDEHKNGGTAAHHRAPSLKSVRIHTAGPSTSSIIHPLKHDYIISCGYRSGNQRLSEADWEQTMKRLTSFGSVESFWNVWSHIKRPSQLPPITDVYIFKLGIAPKWEDPSNVNGGKFVLRLRKGLADRIFESLVLAMIGQQLEPEPATEDSEGAQTTPTALDEAEEICGCVLSVRASEDIISIWNRSRHAERREALRRTIQARLSELALPLNDDKSSGGGGLFLAYKPHHDHLKNHTNASPGARHHQHGHINKRMHQQQHQRGYDLPRTAEAVDEALEAELRETA